MAADIDEEEGWLQVDPDSSAMRHQPYMMRLNVDG